MYNLSMLKISSPHSTYIEQAELLIKTLTKNQNVSKISLGIIKPKKSASKSFTAPKISVLENHILIKVSSKLAVQEIRVYGKDLETIAASLSKKSNK
jgi:hypothetical protein